MSLTWRILAGVAAFVGLGACKPPQPTEHFPDVAPTARSAQSFVHCVEQGTSACIHSEGITGAWDAFSTLIWIAGGTPTALLERLPGHLSSHGDRRLVLARFVEETERYADVLRGAECDAKRASNMRPLVERAAQTAAARLERLSMWSGNLGPLVEGLAREAHEGLDVGDMVEFECRYDPFLLYVGVTDVEGLNKVVGFTTWLPTVLGGKEFDRLAVRARLEGRALGLRTAAAIAAEGVVDAWIPVAPEVF